MAFGFQDSMDFSGGGDSPDSSGNTGILSALENVGVNFAAGAATVGLGAISKSAGVQAPYGLTPYNITRTPGTFAPMKPPVSNNTIVFGGLVLAGLLVWIALRGRGRVGG
jgi:hypothetical protein